MFSSLLAACGEPDAVGAGGLTGSIVISGSSTVEPVSIAVAQTFAEKAPDVEISVDGPGTGDGFEMFCDGETDISDASRAITEEEKADCEQAGISYLELKVANDGIAVVTSPQNRHVKECLSFTDMYALVGPESQGFDRWSDANPLAAELGGTKAAPFPNVPLIVTGPGEESGTYDSFVELVIADLAEQRGEEEQTRPDYQASPDDNVIIQGVEGSRTSFGWVGYAFYAESRDQVEAFQVAGKDGRCVAPSAATTADGSYPVSRSLYIYVNAEKLRSKPALREFVEAYVSDDGLAAAAEVGYVALSEAQARQTQDAYRAFMGAAP